MYVWPSVCMSITLVHPAKAVGRNEMPFGRDTHMVPSNIVLARGFSLYVTKGKSCGSEPPIKIALQIVAKPLQIAEWLL